MRKSVIMTQEEFNRFLELKTKYMLLSKKYKLTNNRFIVEVANIVVKGLEANAERK